MMNKKLINCNNLNRIKTITKLLIMILLKFMNNKNLEIFQLQ